MADEELAQDGLATPATASAPETEPPELETEVESEDGQQPEDDIEFEADDGTKYRIPKALEPALMRNKDYTQKSQARAEAERALAAEKAQVEQARQATDDELDARAELKATSKELDRFKDFSFQAYQQARQVDPMAADEAWNYAQHLRGQKAELEGKIGQFAESRSQSVQQEFAKRVEETRQFAQTKIKGWTPELDQKIEQFVVTKGVTPDFLRANLSPTLYDFFHLAYLGDQLVKKQSAPKPAAPPPEPIRIARGKGVPSPTGLSDELSADEWMKRRNAQLRRKG